MNIIRNYVIPLQLPNRYVSIDTEWHDLKQETIHRPTSGDFSCLTASLDGENVFYITDKEKVIQSLENLKDCFWLIHEAKFDLTQLSRFVPREIIHHKKTIDTLMMEKILFSGYYNRFGLGHLVRRHLGIFHDKELQKSFIGEGMSEEQIEYASRDALYLRQLWDVQKTHITKDDLYVYRNIELPTMFAVMDFQGFCIDVDGWRKLAQDNKAKQEACDEELTKITPITSRQFAKLKEFLQKNGFPNLDSTNEETLTKAFEKHPDTLAGQATKLILDSRMYGKRASTYGESWINNYIETEPDGSHSISCNYNIIGTETFRFCVAGDTILDTDLGQIEIQNLNLTKDKTYLIMSHTGKMQPILNKFYKGKEMMYNVKTENGSHIKCTGGHRILTLGGWKSIRELEIGDLAITKVDKSSSKTTKWSLSDCRRKYICGIDNSEKDEQSGNSEGIFKSNQSNYGHIKTSILEEISRRVEESTTLSILYGIEGQYPRQERSTNSINTERNTLTFDKFWQKIVDYSKGIEEERIFSSDKCQIFRNRSTGRITFWTSTPRFGILGTLRNICSWFSRNSKKLLFKSSNILRKVIRKLFTPISNYLVYQGSSIRSQLLSTTKQNFKKPNLLEHRQKRNDYGSSSLREAYTTYSAIQLLQKLYGGFFLSSIQPDSRNKWLGSQTFLDTGNGQSQTRNYSETWAEFPSNSSSEDEEGFIWCNRFDRSKITSIQECGILDVWDIEVEEDHSYVAQGFIHHNSADAPPMQTLPNRETKDYRKLFIPRKNHVLVVGDFSQQEVGVLAYLCQDKKLIKMFNQGGDIYILTAKEMFGKDITKKDPLRALMKSLVLGIDYGLSKYGLSRKVNISVDEAEVHINKFLRTFPGINEYQINQRKQSTKVKTVLGHKIWLNPYSFQRENNALNAPIQGTAAEMLKLSICDMHKNWSFPFPFGLVGAYHDELVMDIPKDYAKQGHDFMKSCMESMANWLCPGISFRADVHICPNNWNEKELE